jgi:hypothetical protein
MHHLARIARGWFGNWVSLGAVLNCLPMPLLVPRLPASDLAPPLTRREGAAWNELVRQLAAADERKQS